MYALVQRQSVEPVRLFLIHNPYIDTVQVDFLLGVKQVIHGFFPCRIGKEIIVEDFYVLAVGIEVDRSNRCDISLFLTDETERASSDTSP
jgi:hypothetical protein